MKYVKIGIVMSFLIFAAAFFAVPDRSAEAVELSAAEQRGPRTLYVQNCARCHGANGKAQNASGRRLGAPDLTADDIRSYDGARLIRIIENGRPDMPAFKRKLTRKQIAMIANYVRTM